MGMFDYFRTPRDKSATVAKERLQVIVAHERAERGRPSYLPKLHSELLEVICKYVHVDPQDVQVSVDKNTELKVEGIDKQAVGQFAAEVRKVRPPEPYKGKGIRYADEHVRRKVGKTATGSAG